VRIVVAVRQSVVVRRIHLSGSCHCSHVPPNSLGASDFVWSNQAMPCLLLLVALRAHRPIRINAVRAAHDSYTTYSKTTLPLTFTSVLPTTSFCLRKSWNGSASTYLKASLTDTLWSHSLHSPSMLTPLLAHVPCPPATNYSCWLLLLERQILKLMLSTVSSVSNSMTFIPPLSPSHTPCGGTTPRNTLCAALRPTHKHTDHPGWHPSQISPYLRILRKIPLQCAGTHLFPPKSEIHRSSWTTKNNYKIVAK